MSDDWNPQPAKLRDGETRDDGAHASRNLQQLLRIANDDELPEDRRQSAMDRVREMQSECADSDNSRGGEE